MGISRFIKSIFTFFERVLRTPHLPNSPIPGRFLFFTADLLSTYSIGFYDAHSKLETKIFLPNEKIFRVIEVGDSLLHRADFDKVIESHPEFRSHIQDVMNKRRAA